MAETKSTWKAHKSEHGKLDAGAKNDLPESAFAFPKHRKEPMTDASHVRNAIARFDQVQDVSNEDRELAFNNIKKAAEHFGVEMKEDHWRQLGKSPRTAHSTK